MLRDFSRAVEIGLKTPTIVTDGPAYLAAAYARLGEGERAEFHLAEFHKVFRERIAFGRPFEAEEPLRWLLHVNPFRRAEDTAYFAASLQLAGIAAEAAPAPAETHARPAVNAFRKEGALWMMCYEQEVVRVPEEHGFQDIAYLLGRSAEETH